jgi:environmental stress-induced protein Ves
MTWKNGGGETTQIAVNPPDSGLDQFDWRVSTARVASDGPFSSFPGIDRTLAILAGEGLRLSIGGKAPIVLTSRSEPFTFAGDVKVDAALVSGEITDLNVMTRRGRFAHRINRIDIAGSTEFQARGAETLLYCAEGEVSAQTPQGAAVLGRGDGLLGGAKGTWRLQTGGDALAYCIEFLRLVDRNSMTAYDLLRERTRDE